MSVDYRSIARLALERARNEIAGGDSNRLPYAALELRGALEALTYDKAQCYKDEIPADVYRTWQPPKLVEFITEVDSKAYVSRSVSFGLQDGPGKPAKVMHKLGTETTLSMKNLKDHYGALGSYLHIPTLDQIEKGKIPDKQRLLTRCNRCIYLVEKVLSSSLWNTHSGAFAEMECVRCNFPMKKRLRSGFTEPVDARCINCGAEYTVTNEGDGRTEWTPKGHEIACPTPGCAHKIGFWEDQLRPGTAWKCEACGEGYILKLSIEKWAPGESDDPKIEA